MMNTETKLLTGGLRTNGTNTVLEDYMREMVYHLHQASLGTADYQKNQIFGEIHAMARSPHHKPNIEFLKSRGMTYTDFITSNDNILHTKITSPVETVDVSVMDSLSLDVNKEIFSEWYTAQSTPTQRKIEECNLWHKKIINAYNSGERDFSNWSFIDRSF